jgi:hypothetical protein
MRSAWLIAGVLAGALWAVRPGIRGDNSTLVRFALGIGIGLATGLLLDLVWPLRHRTKLTKFVVYALVLASVVCVIWIVLYPHVQEARE